MATRFYTKTKVRFGVIGYSPEDMIKVGTALRDSIEQRILRAEDLGDSPAPPLKIPLSKPASVRGSLARYQRASYPMVKERSGRKPIRDWCYSGILLRHMKVLTATVNQAVIGFIEAIHPVSYHARKGRVGYINRKHPMTMNDIAAINNKRWRQFGVSPKDRDLLHRVFAALKRPVTTKAA